MTSDPRPGDKPSLVLRPWNHAGTAVSLREVTNTQVNLHHGMQSSERFGAGVDADRDGVADELTRADITAVSAFEATLPVPGRVIPNDPDVEKAVSIGERLFAEIRCSACHIPSLPLDHKGWIYSEPNPFNPPGNLRSGEVPDLKVDLSSDILPPPRVKAVRREADWHVCDEGYLAPGARELLMRVELRPLMKGDAVGELGASLLDAPGARRLKR